jgi:hypothetical protein
MEETPISKTLGLQHHNPAGAEHTALPAGTMIQRPNSMGNSMINGTFSFAPAHLQKVFSMRTSAQKCLAFEPVDVDQGRSRPEKTRIVTQDKRYG